MLDGVARREGRRYRVRGLVQGVGFRPFVWRIANEEGVAGFVLNDSDGVLIEASGALSALARLEFRLTSEAPPLSRVDAVECSAIAPAEDCGFSICESRGGVASTSIAADAATCCDCLTEVFDSASRRFGYAFTNCTNCGPRLSIVRGVPYDRANTAMSAFPMCADCAREYADPADRRFHAEPIACPACGPRLWLETAEEAAASPLAHSAAAVAHAAALIEGGGIVAIKGLGGFHLACDATSESAVARLRARKRRDAKPLAVMVRDLDMARDIASVSDAEAALLCVSAAPIVLLGAYDGGVRLAPSVAPGNPRFGVMLPATPLHHLLLRSARRPLVMTSGNVSSEPQCTGNDEARRRLGGIADAWLMHDRDIVNRVDDSVARIDRFGPTLLRRARGFAPEALRLAADFCDAPPVLALGGELKTTVCFARDGSATLSQHLGDLEEAQTRLAYRATIELYRAAFCIEPSAIAVDLHPNYASTLVGEEMCRGTSARLVRIQHHHAHLAACLAENGIGRVDARRQPTLGIILDGTGLGSDGTIWGGEFLLGDYRGFVRVGNLAPVAMPGGEVAAREPWRNTLAQLIRVMGNDWQQAIKGSALGEFLDGKPVAMLSNMIARRVNAPLASSTGRLFDAVAGALGICANRQSYEGQAGMALEALAEPYIGATEAGYPLTIAEQGNRVVVDPAGIWPLLVADLRNSLTQGVVSARFHAGLIDALAAAALRIARQHEVRRVALSGGVFANRILNDGLAVRLAESGLHVLRHSRVPANDGGLALGQACIAAATTAEDATITGS